MQIIKNIDSIIQENKKRVSDLLEDYDPIKGINTVTRNKELRIDSSSVIKLPSTLFDESWVKEIETYGSISNYMQVIKMQSKTNELINHLTRERFEHDPEFWFATCVTVADKDTGKEVPFILNKPQRKLLREFEYMRISGLPIRIIILKARQWGGSTLTQLYFAWIQLFLKCNWNSAVIADVEDQSRHIRGMFTKLLKFHPKQIKDCSLLPYEGSSKTRIIPERKNIIGVGSVQKPENLRGFPIHMVHMSEVGFWKKTAGKSGEDLAQAVRSGIPRNPLSAIVLESTAKGTGTFFHKEWQKASKKENSYRAVFIPWYEIEKYREDIPYKEIISFIENMNEYDWLLWELGATLEGIKWYNGTKYGENFSDLEMQSEYPSTPDEAFQSTGSRIIPKQYVKKHEKEVLDPEFVGELYGGAIKGPEALNKLIFENNIKGRFSVWVKPDTSIHVANRYGVFVDIGGRSKDSDWTVITVIDRYMLLFSGAIEVVATWRGHLDQDLVAWKAAQISTWYNMALLAVEVNSLENKANEGDHSLTILDEISEYYDNIFFRNNPETVKEEFTRYGFHTNKKTKSMIINRYIAALRDDEIIERQLEALKECDWFELKDNGTMGAVEGQHDDILITRAGCTWLCLSYMEEPYVINPDKNNNYRKSTFKKTLADF